MLSYTLIIVCVLYLAKSEDSPFSRKTLEESWEEQLMKDLKAKDGISYAPNETTEISVHYFLKRFTMGEDETTFVAYGWLIISWNDPRLKWKETDYYGISEVIFSSYNKFWEPSLRLLNEEENMMDYDQPFGLCSLDKDGDVVCIPRVLHEAPCQTKLSNWPHDVMTCTLQMGLYALNANINIKKLKKVVTLFGAEYGGEFTIVNYTVDYKSVQSIMRKSDNGTQLDVNILVVREGEGLGAIVVFPTIILTMLTLISFLLSVKDNLRLGIICFNLWCHFFFLSELSELIPKFSEDSPTILYFLRDSVLINILLVLFTMFLDVLRKKKVPAPSWISITNGIVLEGRGGFLVWPRWKVELQKESSEEAEIILSQWADFSDMLNSLGLWVVIFLYLLYICVYIPRPTSDLRI